MMAGLAVAVAVALAGVVVGLGGGTRHVASGRMNHGLRVAVGSEAYSRLLAAQRVEVAWFNQTLDHFNPQDTRTFPQQYQVNGTFYRPGGPVFLLLGGEGPASPAWLATDTAIMTYAATFNALVVQLEHRFYGKSQPAADLSLTNLRFLSSEQALADAADFVLWFRASMGLPEESKVVSFGGSYSGALSAFLRTKYPHVIHAAVATSAPVEAKLDYFEYQEVVGQSLATSTHGAACVTQVAAGTQAVKTLLHSPANYGQLFHDFVLCKNSELEGNLNQQFFLDNLAGNIDGIVQYNLDTFHGVNPTIQDMCDRVMGASDPYTGYAALQQYLVNASGASCQSSNYSDYMRMMNNISLESDAADGTRQWTYQTCVEFAYFQTSDAGDQPFGDGFPLPFFEQQCVDGFGLPPVPNTNWTNNYYGGKNIQGTRIVYPNGSIDPWHALGIVANTTVPETEAIYISGTAHCANMYPPRSTDLPGLTAARASIAACLARWLAE